jgi:hypothetical protein
VPDRALSATSTSERVAFRQITKATGNRLRQQLIDDETREPVAPEHKGRGYEVGKGQYLIVEDDEPHDEFRGGSYTVVKQLPHRDGELEYRIKNAAEPHERVARESLPLLSLDRWQLHALLFGHPVREARNKAITVGHLHLRQRLRVDGLARIDQFVLGEDVGR